MWIDHLQEATTRAAAMIVNLNLRLLLYAYFEVCIYASVELFRIPADEQRNCEHDLDN